MNIYLEKYKGIHPGIILERELKKRALQQRPFALSIGEHPQTLNAITKGKCKLNTALALKIEERLGLEDGTLAILQTYFDINEEKHKREGSTPNLSLIRKSLFWDTDITMIDWDKHYKAVIRRIFERGNEIEKQELINFYGIEKIDIALSTNSTEPYVLNKNK
jgi:plasmid maintenance system antidote protein VapI